LPAALSNFPSPILASFATVALLATMQSSADSVLLTAASATARDVAPFAGRALDFRAARFLVPVYGALGLLVALGMREIVETLKLGYSIFAAGMILPILFGFFPALWVPAPDAVAAMVAGGSVALLGRFFPGLLFHLDPVIAGTAVNLALLLFGIARTRLRGRCPGDYGLKSSDP
jgi:Na+/proline symporter